ncbi:glycosyl transferase family group 2-domain-containing protein [Pestalotiopsis sp. NC0098]|nr:glycosyl transferase family group 2-domain-containing protein [Pestalotiopsis sp. NC0098]
MEAVFGWTTRRAGGLAMIATIALSYWVVSKEAASTGYGYYNIMHTHHASAPSAAALGSSTTGGGMWTLGFAYYCLFIHILVAAFPIRACWSIFSITRTLKKNAKSKALRDIKLSHRRRGSSTSLSSSETLTSSRDGSVLSSATSSEAGDLDTDQYTDGDASAIDNIVHAVVIPNYKEEVDTLRETLDVLASHPQARHSYDIYLGMEQREHNAELKAMNLIQEFVKKFRSIDFTLHPSDIPGEAPGKGSNMAWAARKLSERYSMTQRKDVIVTGIDADSHLSSKFFASLTSMHLAHPETASTTLYSAPIIFDRNANDVPAIVRVADILWSAAGMSGLYHGSSIAPPTSVYSVPLVLADRVGGWDADSEAIGEDLHMYLKCFFAMNGNLTSRTVLSPVSQSNVSGDGGKGISGLITDMRARYKQALRHMWGCLDSGYAMRKGWELWQERKHTSRNYRPLHITLSNPSDTYIPQVDGLSPGQNIESGIFADITTDTLKDVDWMRVLSLAHRLFEAHFLPVQMTILVIASTLYLWVTEGNGDPHNLTWLFTVCNVLRTAGFMQIAFYLFLYESFHKFMASAREKEMNDAGLAKGMCFAHRDRKMHYLDYVMVPLVAPMYGSIPGAQAQVFQFWTQDLVYTVSKKVVRQRSKSLSADAMV